jgi:hypothetical protein
MAELQPPDYVLPEGATFTDLTVNFIKAPMTWQ